MYTCHFSVLRASAVREVGGFHEGFEGSQDHDLVLRVTERARKVVHIPKILYHWRVIPGSAAGDPHAKPYAWVAGVKAVQAHLDRMGIDATADFGPGHSTYRIIRKLDPAVLVSVVIPTAGAEGLVFGEHRFYVVEAVRTLLERSGHDNVEIVVVHDAGTNPAALEQLRAAGRAPAPAGALRQGVQLQREVQPRRAARPGRRRAPAQRRHRGRERRLRRPARRAAVRGGRRHDRRAAALPRRPDPERRPGDRPAAGAHPGARAR